MISPPKKKRKLWKSDRVPLLPQTESSQERNALGRFSGLRDFLFETVYTSSIAKREDKKAQELLKRLFDYYCRHPEQLPDEYKTAIEEEGVERKVCDYIAGMTDRYAIAVYKNLYIPEVWKA